jgi:hypothetical protein
MASWSRGSCNFLPLLLSAIFAVGFCQNFRLPLNVIPHHYEANVLVHLDPALSFQFEGNVNIHFTCVEATDTVIVHNYLLLVEEDLVVLRVGLNLKKKKEITLD